MTIPATRLIRSFRLALLVLTTLVVLDDGAAATQPEFAVQRGSVVIPDGDQSITLLAGSDYAMPTGPAFVRITGTRLSGAGRTSGGGPQPPDRWMAWITIDSALSDSFTVSRFSTQDDTRVAWELIEFVGDPLSPNAMLVRSAQTVQFGAGSYSLVGLPTPVDADEDVVVFVTGQAADESGGGGTHQGLFTASWDAGLDQPVLSRGGIGAIATVSCAVVEFTGSNWSVERLEHTYFEAGVIETEFMTPVPQVTEAFFHAQHRSGTPASDQLGAEIWISDPTTISFQLDGSALDPSSATSVAWVVSNPEAQVQHFDGLRFSGGSEEDVWTEAIVMVPASEASIMGENARCDGLDNVPHGSIALQLIDDNDVELRQSDTAVDQVYRFSVVRWPALNPVSGHKTWVLQIDGDGNGEPTPGDVIRYTISLENIGAIPLTLHVEDGIPAQAASWSAVSLGGGTDASAFNRLIVDDVSISVGGLVEIILDVVIADDTGGQVMFNTAEYDVAPGGDTGSLTAPPVVIATVTGAASPELSRQPILLQNHPNPFNPSTTIWYLVPHAIDGELVVYDLAGRRVRTLVAGTLEPGRNQVSWNGEDDAGHQMASGVYLYRLRAGDFVETRRMILLK